MNYSDFVDGIYRSVMFQAKNELNIPGIISDVKTDAWSCNVNAQQYISIHRTDFGPEFISSVAKQAQSKDILWMPDTTEYLDLKKAYDVMRYVGLHAEFKTPVEVIETSKLLYALGAFSVEVTKNTTPKDVLTTVSHTYRTDAWEGLSYGYKVFQKNPHYDLLIGISKLYWHNPQSLYWRTSPKSFDDIRILIRPTLGDRVAREIAAMYETEQPSYVLDIILQAASKLTAKDWGSDYVTAFANAWMERKSL